MIIQCRKCATKFRFDDNLVTRDGVWVRCSLCSHVFHQDAPGEVPDYAREDKGLPAEDGGMKAAPQETETASGVSGREEVNGQSMNGLPADDADSLDHIGFAKGNEEAVVSRIDEIREAVKEGGLDFAGKEFEDMDGLPDAEGGQETAEDALPEEEMKRRPARGSWGRLLALLVVAALLGGSYFWLYPESRKDAVRLISSYLPLLEKVLGKSGSARDEHANQIKLVDVRQHFINNWLMGNLRVVEGAAVNIAGYPLTRIQIKGALYDSAGVQLAEQISFGGNLLTDAELATQTEEEIQSKLTLPEGSNVPNERINPGGRIPFMVVFTREQPGVTKTTVTPAAAERLLEK